MYNLIRVCGLAALLVALTGTVQAQDLDERTGPLDRDERWSAALLLGYGIDFEDLPVNPFGLALGVRGGYTLEQNIYLGGQFMFFGGGSEAGVSWNVVTLGVEGGYDLWVEPLIIRPSLGLGIAFANASVEIAGMEFDNSDSALYLAPGAAVLYPLEDKFFIGGDGRLWVITDEGSLTGFSIMVTGGMKF